MLNIFRLTLIIFIINLILISYTAYIFYSFKSLDSTDVNNNWKQYSSSGLNENVEEIDSQSLTDSLNKSNEISIEIWSKASIGLYLWQHILRGSIDSRVEENLYLSGSTKVDGFRFKFRSGPLLTSDSLQHMTNQNLILVLNGRDKQKISFATDWLKAVDAVKSLVANVGLVVLGDEQCRNNWIKPYLQVNGGFVKFLFIVYDWKSIDNKVIYQWPLGVATYRYFPNPEIEKLVVETSRPYVCNFVATIYSDSSRLELLNILNRNYSKICIIKPRFEWTPKETSDSLNYYVEALRLSDLTLSPIGMNHECYRIFESMAFGSVPVVEENVNHVIKTSCDTRSAFRLLKANNAPIIYVTNWTQQLPNIIQNEINYSLEYKIKRRLKIIKFYAKFKTIIRKQFLNVINEYFD